MCWHKYKEVVSRVVSVVCSSDFRVFSWEESRLLKMFKCSKCNKIKGYTEDNYSNKKELSELEIIKLKEVFQGIENE